MYSRVAAAYSRAVFPRYALRGSPQLRGIPRTQGLLTARFPIFRDARYLSTPSANRTKEFSETEALPREEASLNITDAAAEQLRNIAMRESDEDIALRVLVESGGCHGYQYKMELTSERQPSDYHFVRPPTTPGRVGVVVDPISLSLLKGSTIDFATELIGSSFRVLDNPQATGKGCGCGVSWELKA
ncbi:[4Fe-4S] proteins maturation [Ceratobasidium sp. UAMH 11750]|nr:[4Fe-4S] proteins maturation [Ceratobasidium sp. UAMH 11750]